MIPETLSELPTASARVECSGQRHTIRWTRGELLALDHGDPEGERALAVLGGTSCACLDILISWARNRASSALLAAISRGQGDFIQSDGFGTPVGLRGRRGSGPALQRPGIGTSGATGWVAYAPLSGPTPAGARGQYVGSPDTPEEEIALLAGLGHDITRRLAATISDALLHQLSTDHSSGPTVRPTLEASLFGRVSNALRMWLDASDLDVELQVDDQPENWALTRDLDGSFQICLPLEWVAKVWGRDLAVVAGRFTLGVVESSPTRITLNTVDPDLEGMKLLTIEMA